MPIAASAQPINTTLPQAGQGTATGEVVKLTRDEAVRMALENNPDLAVTRFEPAVSDARVSAAHARLPAAVHVVGAAQQHADTADQPVLG